MSFVYFIKPIGMDGPIKIGCSDKPGDRRATLETWSPLPLEVVAQIKGDFELERRFHTMFVADHQRREWFTVTDALLAVIASINAGTFDEDVLPPMGKRLRSALPSRNWSPEKRREVSFMHRINHKERKTGFQCPVSCRGMIERGDTEIIAAVERFLEKPHVHGIARPWPWARERQEKYLASLPPEALAA